MINDDDKVPRASEYENGPEDTKEGVHKRDQNSKGGAKMEGTREGRMQQASPPLHTQPRLYRAGEIISRAVHGRG